MDWLQFIASVVGSLAWPGAVLALVFLLRDQVNLLLRAITKIKYNDLEIDFDRELKRITIEAKAIDVLPAKAKLDVPAPAEFPRDRLAEAERLVNEFPEPAIAVAWSAVEDGFRAAKKLVSNVSIGLSRQSTLKMAQDLTKDADLPEGTTDLVRRMANLRNVAVHGGNGGVPITADEAREFIALSRGLVEKLETLNRRS